MSEPRAQKKLLMIAAVIFGMTSVVAIAGNSLLGHGWHPNYSISKYVGLETWSVLVFALGNFVVAGLLGRYLFQVGRDWRMPRWYFWVVVLLVAALVGLSVWPCGYFDRNGVKSLVTVLHEISSRTMFVGMVVVALTLMSRKEMRRVTKVGAGVFVVYGLVCCLGYLTKGSWFVSPMLFFEGAYIWGFMALVSTIKRKDGNGKIEEKAV